MGRKRIYMNDAARKRASRERNKRAGITEPSPWIIYGVPDEVREEVTEIADERRLSGSQRSTIGQVVTEYLSEALKNNPVDENQLYDLDQTVFDLLLDLRSGRSAATGAALERRLEAILDLIAGLID